MKSTNRDIECPCGLGGTYLSCCGKYIEQGGNPQTAERLMRSRYCAYVFGREDYLLHTWHASTRPSEVALRNIASVKWLGLRILATQSTESEDTQARVEFVARYAINGKAERLHETSRFVLEAEQWFYVDGDLH